MATVTWSLLADFDRDGSYEFDLTPYIDSPGHNVRISRGIGRDGQPRASKFTVTLSNRDGIFTPENTASSLYGKLDPGAPVQLSATAFAQSFTIWTGYTLRWRVDFPNGGESEANVECVDLFWFLQEGDPVNITADTTRDTDAALTAIANYLGLVAGDLNFDDGVQDLPMHFAVGESPIDAMKAVVASEMGGLLYPGADGRIRFEARNSRLGITPLDGTWGDGTSIKPTAGEGYAKDALEYFTNVTARATIFRTGQADTRIFEFSQNMFTKPTATSMAMAAGEVYERTFQANSAYVALTTPVAYVDYLANAAVDGSGADRTGSLTVTVTDLGGGRFRIKLAAALALYVTKFGLRGQPVEFFADRAEAAFSLAVPGQKAGSSIQFDVPFAGDSGNKMRDYAYQELRVGRYFWPTLTLPFVAAFEAEIVAVLGAELGDLIKYKSPATNIFQTARVDDWWYIEGLEYSLSGAIFGEAFTATVTLIPSYVYRNLDAIAFDTFERADATGDLGTSYSGDVWADDAGFNIVSNVARANSDTLQMPTLDLADDAELTNEADLSHADWAGYWVKPAITTGVADPHGGTGAFSLASADHGGAGGNRSGILQTGVLPAGTYTVEFWGKCTAGTLAITYGLDDGVDDAAATLTTTWQRFQRTIVAAVATARRFQVYENTAANTAWQLYGIKVYQGTAPTDHVVEVTLAAVGAGDEVGVVARYVDANNYYRAYVDKGSNEVILEKVVAGVVTELSSPALTVGTSHEIQLMIQGSRLRVRVDRKLQIDTTDSALTAGTRVGIMARNANGTATFDNWYGQGL